MSVDKNLLFGLVAYQNGYITQEQFFQAGAVWNKDPNKDLGEILVEKKFLEEIERFNLQGIVEDRLRRLGGTDNTLSFVIGNGSVPTGELLPDDWKSRIEEITKIISISATPVLPQLINADSPTDANRYVIGKELGHGGQGYVWEAVDTVLNRRVAIKNVVPKHSNDPLHQELLIDEARKTGKIGHAGVPSVYDIGKDAEGNPFFTMQVIRGEKLSEKYGELKYEGISQSDFVNQIRPLLKHLIAACNTVQFAYEKETLIHRDLKPANIMVNNYGETVVMDWGMGKIVDDPSQNKADASSVLIIPWSTSSGAGERTSVRVIKGSVNFMSPEQARAENDRLDHRTDIYGLGAILYWVITGRPPHDKDALLEIQKNRFAPPSQVRPTLRIPPELEAICLKAMSSAPEDRYQKSGEMAADLDNFIAGEPVSALPENYLRKTERFLRKNARAVIASLLGLSLAVLGLSVANAIISRQKNMIAKANKEVTASRRVASDTMEEIIGKLFDDRISQLPGAHEVRLELLSEIANKIEAYLTSHPEDTELKLDLARLLTRLAKLELDNKNTEKANEHLQRGEELLKETKDHSDQDFQNNWQKTFCDRAYYQSIALLENRELDDAEALISESLKIAQGHWQAIKDNPKEKRTFTPVYARLHRQQASIAASRENWPQALDETIKAASILKPYVEAYLPKLNAEPTSTERIPDLSVGELGYYILLRDDQGDYEAILKKFADAQKSYVDGLQACSLAPRVDNALRDGTVQKANMLRKLQRLALLNPDLGKADGYYQQALEVSAPDRQKEPLIERHWFFIECDRARGLAQTNVQEARSAITKAESTLNNISATPRTMAEFQYCLAAAKAAIAKAENQADSAALHESQKAIELQKLKDLKASPFKVLEVQWLP
jgi:serine/threonine protein kinase